MTDTMRRTVDLPECNVTRELIYQLIETMQPTADLVDGASIEVANNVLTAGTRAPRWRKYSLDHEDFQAAAATNQATLFTLEAGGVIHRVVIKHSASFVGGAIATYTLSVGLSGNLTKYAAAYDVFQAAGDAVFQQTGNEGATPDGLENFGSSTLVQVEATATGANLDASTAGAVDIYVLWSVLPIT